LSTVLTPLGGGAVALAVGGIAGFPAFVVAAALEAHMSRVFLHFGRGAVALAVDVLVGPPIDVAAADVAVVKVILSIA